GTPAGGGEQERQGDVLLGGEGGKQVEELEDEADLPPPEDCDLVVAHPRDRRAADDDLALGGLIEPSQEMQQRALAGAARPHHGDPRAAGAVRVHAAHRAARRVAVPEDLPYAAQGDHVGNGRTWTRTTGLLRVKQAL